MRAAGAKVEWLDGEEARKCEPLLSNDCIAALYYPDEGIVDPMRLTWAYAELAALRPKAGGEYVYLREAYHPAVGATMLHHAGLRDRAVIATKVALEWPDGHVRRNASAERIRSHIWLAMPLAFIGALLLLAPGVDAASVPRSRAVT